MGSQNRSKNFFLKSRYFRLGVFWDRKNVLRMSVWSQKTSQVASIYASPILRNIRKTVVNLENRIFHSLSDYSSPYVDQKLNTCWPKCWNLSNMMQGKYYETYSRWRATQISEMHQTLWKLPFFTDFSPFSPFLNPIHVDMLPKRSTHVDQNFRIWQLICNLSQIQFIASETA